MKAIVIENDGGPQAGLALREVPAPVPTENDLRVAVRAAALNRADLRRAANHFAGSDKSRQAAIAGVEFAGEVIGLGAAVRGYKVGDRVMAMGGGAYAEEACIDYRFAIPVPEGFTWQEAAATPVSFIAAHDAIVTAGGLKAGEDVLIQGGSTGAGIAAIQIAKLLGAKTVMAVAGDPGKLAQLTAIGCDVTLSYTKDDVAAAVMRRTNNKGVELVIDVVGGSAAQINIDSLAIRGRIVCLGRVAGLDATINLDEFSRKRAHMIGVTFRSRSLAERIEALRLFREQMVPALAAGKLRPVIDSEIPLARAAEAQERMRANLHFGKIVLLT